MSIRPLPLFIAVLPLISLTLGACAGATPHRDAPTEVIVMELDPGPSFEVDLDDTDALAEVVTESTEPAAGPGQDEAPEPVLARFRLRRGETLAHFARWSELPVEVVAETSGLDLSGTYPVGTAVLLPVEGSVLSRVERRRDRHHTRRVEGYLASRGGALGTDFVKVRTGDTAWSIARDANGLPVWVLESFNPATDLDDLRPGQELMVPVVNDIVVSAEAPLEPGLD